MIGENSEKMVPIKSRKIYNKVADRMIDNSLAHKFRMPEENHRKVGVKTKIFNRLLKFRCTGYKKYVLLKKRMIKILAEEEDIESLENIDDIFNKFTFPTDYNTLDHDGNSCSDNIDDSIKQTDDDKLLDSECQLESENINVEVEDKIHETVDDFIEKTQTELIDKEFKVEVNDTENKCQSPSDDKEEKINEISENKIVKENSLDLDDEDTILPTLEFQDQSDYSVDDDDNDDDNDDDDDKSCKSTPDKNTKKDDEKSTEATFTSNTDYEKDILSQLEIKIEENKSLGQEENISLPEQHQNDNNNKDDSNIIEDNSSDSDEERLVISTSQSEVEDDLKDQNNDSKYLSSQIIEDETSINSSKDEQISIESVEEDKEQQDDKLLPVCSENEISEVSSDAVISNEKERSIVEPEIDVQQDQMQSPVHQDAGITQNIDKIIDASPSSLNDENKSEKEQNDADLASPIVNDNAEDVINDYKDSEAKEIEYPPATDTDLTEEIMTELQNLLEIESDQENDDEKNEIENPESNSKCLSPPIVLDLVDLNNKEQHELENESASNKNLPSPINKNEKPCYKEKNKLQVKITSDQVVVSKYTIIKEKQPVVNINNKDSSDDEQFVFKKKLMRAISPPPSTSNHNTADDEDEDNYEEDYYAKPKKLRKVKRKSSQQSLTIPTVKDSLRYVLQHLPSRDYYSGPRNDEYEDYLANNIYEKSGFSDSDYGIDDGDYCDDSPSWTPFKDIDTYAESKKLKSLHLESSCTFEDLSEDDEIYMIEMPKCIIDEGNLEGQSLKLRKHFIEIGDTRYNISRVDDNELTLLLKTNQQDASYRLENIQPKKSIIIEKPQSSAQNEEKFNEEEPKISLPTNLKRRNPFAIQAYSKRKRQTENDAIEQKKLKLTL